MLEIIALVGPIGAGKSEIAKILSRFWLNSSVISISSLIREELDAEGIIPTRQAYSEMVIRRREKWCLHYWVVKAIVRAIISGYRRVIIDAVRNPTDLKFLTDLGAAAIEVMAPRELRFKRVRERPRAGEPEADEDLWQMLRDDMHSGEPSGFNIPGCIPACHWQFDGARPIPEQYYQVLRYLATNGYKLNPEEVAHYL